MSVRVWPWIRIFAAVGLLSYAAITSVIWLRLSIAVPLKGETINVRGSYDVSAIESDIRMLHQYLRGQSKVGYLSEKHELDRWRTRLRLAPLILDYDWGRYDFVLVDYPVRRGLEIIQSPSYQLVTDLRGARTFAAGLRIYRRVR